MYNKDNNSFDSLNHQSCSPTLMPNGSVDSQVKVLGDNIKHDEENSEVEVKNGVFDTRSKKLILASISLYWFIVCCAYSMIAPFFPGEAGKKGASITVVGMIFAVFPLVMFLVSPIVGILIPITGPKTILILGLILEGGAQILFGFLHLMPSGDIFVVFCFLIRIVSALGGAATSTCSLTLLTQTFQDNISPAMGIMETFGGFGMMAGPPIGGFLYSVGGFKLPFLLIGSIALASMVPIYYILPADDIDKGSAESKKGALLDCLKIPAIVVIAVAIVVSGMSLSFLDPTLQKHLEIPFHLNSVKIGLMFLIGPGIYAFMAPLFGAIADKSDSRLLISAGAIIVGISYTLLGPSPFLPSSIFPESLWLNCVALALLGIGVAPFLVPALADMNASAARYGLPDGLATQSALSSIFNSMFNIGAIAGPTLGGILVSHLNFAWASSIFGLMLLFVGFFIFLFSLCERRSKQYKSRTSSLSAEGDETKPLLP